MITFQVERWPNVASEIIPLLKDHHEEVGEQIKLDPDFEQFNMLDAEDAFHIVTVRDDEKLVGYHSSTLFKHRYHSIPVARGDAYWLVPEYRKGSTGVELFKEVEKSLKLKGIKMMYDATTLSLDCGIIFERLGYQPIERLYSKWIGD